MREAQTFFDGGSDPHMMPEHTLHGSEHEMHGVERVMCAEQKVSDAKTKLTDGFDRFDVEKRDSLGQMRDKIKQRA